MHITREAFTLSRTTGFIHCGRPPFSLSVIFVICFQKIAALPKPFFFSFFCTNFWVAPFGILHKPKSRKLDQDQGFSAFCDRILSLAVLHLSWLWWQAVCCGCWECSIGSVFVNPFRDVASQPPIVSETRMFECSSLLNLNQKNEETVSDCLVKLTRVR